MDFRYFMPTRLIFGQKSFATAASFISQLGKNVLLVTGQSSMDSNNFTCQLIEQLAQYHVTVHRFNDFQNSPTTKDVDLGVEIVRQHAIDTVVGLGGGSAMDCGKAIAGVVSSGGTAADVLYQRATVTAAALPIVCIPSTAGTGSELNRSAIITDHSLPFKDGIRSDFLFPQVAIVDSELTWSVPPHITATTGFDVLAHAIESYLSPKSTPITDTLALQAIEIVYRWLPIVIAEPDDARARDQMALASTLMGINLACVGTCFPHRADKSLCALRPEIAHGQSVALFYPYWLESIEEIASKRCAMIVAAIERTTDRHKSMRQNDSGRRCRDLVLQFIVSIGLSTDIRNFGVSENDIQALVRGVAGDLSVNPLPLDRDQLPQVFSNILQGGPYARR